MTLTWSPALIAAEGSVVIPVPAMCPMGADKNEARNEWDLSVGIRGLQDQGTERCLSWMLDAPPLTCILT